jgi:hypothetical protein
MKQCRLLLTGYFSAGLDMEGQFGRPEAGRRFSQYSRQALIGYIMTNMDEISCTISPHLFTDATLLQNAKCITIHYTNKVTSL